MILIADSGSTKTDWNLLDGSKVVAECKTQGFNPYFQSTEQIYEELRTSLNEQLPPDLWKQKLEVHFYGAGCSTPEKTATVHSALAHNFPEATIEVMHDLLAAARALCGDKPGIAAILGTGSNSCYFDGKEVVRNVPSLGYILGDEGSGADIGKQFVRRYLYGELGEELHTAFSNSNQGEKGFILDSVYQMPLPNRYLASLMRFIYDHKNNPEIHSLVKDSFNSFFNHHVNKYKDEESKSFNCVGSVGFLFKDILDEVAVTNGFIPGRVIKSPITGLINFHSRK